MSPIIAQRPLKPIWHLLPSGWSIPFVLLGTSWVVLLGSCSGVMTALSVQDGKPVLKEVETCCLLLGMAILPIGGLLFFIGALLAGRWAARSALLGLTLAMVAIGLFFNVISGLIGENSEGMAMLTILIYTAPVGILILSLLVSVVLAVGEVRKAIAARRELRVNELLRARGEVSFETLAEEVGLSKSAASFLLSNLLRQQKIQAEIDEKSGMIFSPERYARKQRDLVSIVYGRGEVHLDALCRELGLSESRLKELLVVAMQTGTFAGFMDWQRRKVVSGDAARYRQGHQCPSCGAQMHLAGRGLVVCSYCGAEVFLA